ncbi:MAG: hypothetical protein M3O20_09600 [Acidobacteriota bacterium]|nr:hypothetical protein [Acidobacteriota bacterium]
MAEYGNTLPNAHRDTMPSLREWYEKLSEPIHAAKKIKNGLKRQEN